jgi:uncharacterized protein with PIN domain
MAKGGTRPDSTSATAASYALAKPGGEILLYKGDDFRQTDVRGLESGSKQ